MTIKIGDKVQFVSKTSKGTGVAPHVYEVEDVLPAILYGAAYVKGQGSPRLLERISICFKGER